SRLRGNDEVEVTRNLKQVKPNEPDSHFRGNDGIRDCDIYREQQKPLRRHSRAGGNLDLRTTVIFKDYLKVRDSGFPLSWE
ncbi:hypothetical protein, partial [Neisseria meningitidis]|uniref:hypothetical protein n=1 Tax=Neisseria meningitidis TaxID=487 RepID=UPI00197B735B